MSCIAFEKAVIDNKKHKSLDMESTLKRFKIEGLFGNQNVTIDFKDNVKILIGENGLGKTTILNCLYFVLTKKFYRLSLIEFESIYIDFISGKQIEFTKNDLSCYLDEIRRSKRNPRGSIIDRLRTIIDIEELSKIIKIDDLEYNKEERNSILNYILVKTDGRKFAQSSILVDAVYKIISEIDATLFKQNIEILDSVIEGQVMYFPTYRRVEEEIQNLGKIKNFGDDSFYDDFMDESFNKDDCFSNEFDGEALIQFGMEDVEARIDDVKKQIKESSIIGFSKLTGEMLSQLLKGFPNIEKEKINNINSETIKIILRRIGDNLPDNDRNNIIKLIGTEELHKKTELLHFLFKLIDLYNEQKIIDDAIKKFRDVCNKYLVGKEFHYDESLVELKIFRNNTADEVLLKNLSSGEKQIVSLFSKIYLEKTKDLIVLFDEPELSLSMSWQKQLLPDIVNSGKCNFLLAVTHSPFIFKNELDKYAIGMNVYFNE